MTCTCGLMADLIHFFVKTGLQIELDGRPLFKVLPGDAHSAPAVK